jgi:hypothetical protein
LYAKILIFFLENKKQSESSSSGSVTVTCTVTCLSSRYVTCCKENYCKVTTKSSQIYIYYIMYKIYYLYYNELNELNVSS